MPPIFQQSFSRQSTTTTTTQNTACQTPSSPPDLASQIFGPTSEQPPTPPPNLRDAFNTKTPCLSQRISDEGAPRAPQFQQGSVGTGPSIQAPSAPCITQQRTQAPTPAVTKEAPEQPTGSDSPAEPPAREPTPPSQSPETPSNSANPTREPVSPTPGPISREPVVPETPTSVNPTTFREVIPADQPQPPREITPPRDLNPVREPNAVTGVRAPENIPEVREPAEPESKPWYTKVADFFGKIFSFVVNLVKQFFSFLGPVFSFFMNLIKPKPTPSEPTVIPTRTPSRRPGGPRPIEPATNPRGPVTSAPPSLTHAPFAPRNPVRTPES